MKEKERKLYKIGHLTKLLGVTPRTVRYYDQMGLLPHVKRSDGNVRLFDEEDVEIIKKIRRMQKEEYLPLDIIKEKLFGEKKNERNEHIAIVTDSTAVIPSELQKSLDIHVIPMTIELKGKTYIDDGSINKKEFWKRNNKASQKAEVIAPSVETCVEFYKKLEKRGIKKVYSIHLSDSINDTFKNVHQAAAQVADRMEVLPIDSKSTGSGLGLFVVQVAEAIDRNESAAQIDIFINKQIPLIYYTTMVNDLKHITHKNVISDPNRNQPELMEKIYQFKPVFTLDGGNGEINIIDCMKTKAEAKQLLVDHLEEEFKARGRYAKYIMLTYDYLYGEAIEVGNDIKRLCPNTPIYVEEGCIALTVYLGPETLSISIA